MKIRKIRLRRSSHYTEHGHFTLFFSEGGKNMYKDVQRTCAAAVLLINLFV